MVVRHVLLEFSVFPGYEDTWEMVQISLTDITARKKAESYLEYLGTHDVMTKLYNRTFYNEEVQRLDHSNITPISCIYLDVNGLKQLNDNLGHDAGDNILRRFGDILNRAISAPYSPCRIGGDEFVILMPGAEVKTVELTLDYIHELLSVDNQYYASQPIHIAVGFATRQADESVYHMIKRSDQAMYVNKKYFYDNVKNRV